MKLAMSISHEGYTSSSQIARVITEGWAAENVYCVACESETVRPTVANTKAIDFTCAQCSAAYQLKAGKSWNARSIPDGAYASMMAAIESDRVPNLLIMQYTADWTVRNLMLVPSFALNGSAIQRRNPLGPQARRAGWVGCNILLNAMPDTAKLQIIYAGNVRPADSIRSDFARLRPLADMTPATRGWTLDVLRIVQSLDRKDFTLATVYEFEKQLAALHPANQNLRAKIRQQLQVLRDLGLIAFEGGGRYSRSDK